MDINTLNQVPARRSVVKLDPLVASQIAAGEVIERPASVVKELVENSIDAGARNIRIDIEEAGASLIRVSDDGCGMSPQDAKMALERFATSKLSSISDFEHIESLGFRGEALPSIASCSKMTIETNLPSSLLGTCIYVEGGTIVRIEEKGLPSGTTVTVRNLFYNTPARLKFMKSRSREEDAIIDVVLRLALAFPERRFSLNSRGKTVLNTSGNGLLSAISDIYGPAVAGAMAPISYSGTLLGHEIHITGFAGLPSLCRRQRDRQFLSCNSRPIRNANLNWAIDSAYTGLLPPKSYPFVVANISMPAFLVDVNVHPQKAEVRFRDLDAVKSALTSSIRSALSVKGFRVDERPAKVDLEQVTGSQNGKSSWRYHGGSSFPLLGESAAGPYYSSASTSDGMLFDAEVDRERDWEYLGSLKDRYLVARARDSLMIIDKHALSESMAYEALLSGKSGSQDLLMPEVVQLDPREASFLYENMDIFPRMGFEMRLIGERTLLVSRVPVVLGRPIPAQAVTQVIGELMKKSPGQTEASEGTERYLMGGFLAIAACHGSIRSGEPLSRQEAEAMVKALLDGGCQRTCPHGRPVVWEIPISEIDRFFGR